MPDNPIVSIESDFDDTSLCVEEGRVLGLYLFVMNDGTSGDIISCHVNLQFLADLHEELEKFFSQDAHIQSLPGDY